MSNVPLRELRRQCAARTRDFGLSEPYDVELLRSSLARRRGRPIELIPVNTRLGPRGLWVKTDTTDYMAYEQDTTPSHQRHIIAHELAHIACGHVSGLSREDLVQVLLPSLGTQAVRSVLGRSQFSAADEREAEVFASLLLEGTTASGPLPVSELAVARFEALLSGQAAQDP